MAGLGCTQGDAGMAGGTLGTAAQSMVRALHQTETNHALPCRSSLLKTDHAKIVASPIRPTGFGGRPSETTATPSERLGQQRSCEQKA